MEQFKYGVIMNSKKKLSLFILVFSAFSCISAMDPEQPEQVSRVPSLQQKSLDVIRASMPNLFSHAQGAAKVSSLLEEFKDDLSYKLKFDTENNRASYTRAMRWLFKSMSNQKI
jgi:hypothetical protein